MDTATLAQQLDEAELLPPWVTRETDRGRNALYSWDFCIYRDMRTSGPQPGQWQPEHDYQYGFWLIERCKLNIIYGYATQGLQRSLVIGNPQGTVKGPAHLLADILRLALMNAKEPYHAGRQCGFIS